MKNVLKRLENNDDANFFVMKSFVTTVFESDRKKPEYHIFYIKKNSMPDAYFMNYRDLKSRRMNRIEVEHFLKNRHLYTDQVEYVKEHDIEDGSIYNLKSKPFDKSQCVSF